MLSTFKSLALLALLAAGAHCLPSVKRADQPDAPYTVPLSTIKNAIVCPKGIQSRPGGVVLLVHGTAITGSDSWSKGPYAQLLPDLDPGYDVCWLELPDKATGDVQVNSEYVAGAVQPLASQSATGKVSLIGHSQGTICIQWALTFWPSIRPLVEDYVSLAADFHGTTTFPFCPKVGCNKASWQQANDSRFIKALDTCGLQGFVNTTNVVTRYDEIVQPQNGPVVSGWLDSNAARFALQDDNVCGPGHITTHSFMLIDTAAFGLAYSALTTAGGPAQGSIPRDCSFYRNTPATTSEASYAVAFGPALMGMVTSLLTNIILPKVNEEPKLKAYVCDRGCATRDQCEA